MHKKPLHLSTLVSEDSTLAPPGYLQWPPSRDNALTHHENVQDELYKLTRPRTITQLGENRPVTHIQKIAHSGPPYTSLTVSRDKTRESCYIYNTELGAVTAFILGAVVYDLSKNNRC